ncbi:metal-binding protein, partial [Rhizobium ruizarguesonis]
LRSLYRLVARETPDFQAQENARLRDSARSLSAIRDATALIGTAQYLHHAARGNEESEALGRMRAFLRWRPSKETASKAAIASFRTPEVS